MPYRYKVHNPATGERYEFTAADQTAAEEQIAANRASYGDAPTIDIADVTNELATEQTKAQQAIDLCRSYNPATATAAEVRATLGASLFLLRRIMRELQ
jgi:hypothetical protein